MTKSEQLAVFEKYAGMAYELALDDFAAHHERIVAMARARFTKGADQFGGVMFRTRPDLLFLEELEEAADMLNYRIASMYQMDQRREISPVVAA